MSIDFMMWNDKIKLLVISYNSHFLSEVQNELEEHFDIQRANSEQVAFFLIREADIKLAVVDFESPLMGSSHALRKAFGYNIGLIGCGQGSRNTVEQAFKLGCDQFVDRGGNAQRLMLSLFALKKRLDRTHQVEGRSNPDRKESRAKIKLGDIEVYPNDYLVHYKGEVVRTTPTQFKLLLSFVSKTDELLTREWLQEHIWEDSNISHRSIDAHISKLKKLIPDLSESLINIYGKGYMLSTSSISSSDSSESSAA